MDHQDHTVILLRKKTIQSNAKPIKSIPNIDLHAIKIENEQENFKIATIPKNMSNQIAQTRNVQKITQKEMAQKLGIQLNVYVTLENGKAQWNGPTKQMVNKIENVLKIKFQR